MVSGGTVGQRIRIKRKQLHLSQEALAERMNLTGAIISNYENDKVDIKMSVMRELAHHLGTTVSFLADGEDDSVLCDETVPVKLRDSEIQTLIRIYSLISTPKVRTAALEQMKILNGL